MTTSTPLLKPPLDTYPSLPEDDPDPWGEEFYNQSILALSPQFDENLGQPLEMLNLQCKQARV